MEDKITQPSPAYYAVIPADVRYADAIQPNAKLLYGEITALCNQEGHCWASNDYFAELYGVTASTISRWISALEKQGYIHTEMVATEKGSERHIYGGIFVVDRLDGGGTQKAQDPPGGVRKNAERGLRKKRKTPPPTQLYKNNITVNNIPPKSPKHKQEWFFGFWDFYPHERRGSLQRAIKAWDKLKPDEAAKNKIAYALKRFKACDAWKRGVGIPLASTFINPDNEYWLHPENFLGGAEARGDRYADGATVEGRNLPTWG